MKENSSFDNGRRLHFSLDDQNKVCNKQKDDADASPLFDESVIRDILLDMLNKLEHRGEPALIDDIADRAIEELKKAGMKMSALSGASKHTEDDLVEELKERRFLR